MSREKRKTPAEKTRLLDSLIHSRNTDERPWKYFPLVLALGFIARAAVALSGDFVLHPDEIMQYLEPAHRLAFGNGVSYWEYFYGARSWLVPGTIAGVLRLFDIAGLGEPFWYVGGVKLFFCAVSLLVPAGMYFFARRHFSETAARVALVAGAFWYELVVFAHKPMTEFVATALLMSAFALCLRGPGEESSGKKEILAGVLATLAAAVRLQYAPLALLALGAAFLKSRRKTGILIAAVSVFFAVGLFDALTWNGGLFHSYIVNLRFNFALSELRPGESPFYQYLLWLLLSSLGLSALCAAAALSRLRRYGFLLGLIVLVLLPHSLQTHKEYRFVFAVIPLWLLIGSDLMARIARKGRGRIAAASAIAVFAFFSLAGIFNSLPYQKHVYKGYSGETGIVGFARNQDPVFAAYRHLARTPEADAVWHMDRPYFNSPGYYYLHRKIPFYDNAWGRMINRNPKTVSGYVTHVVSEDPEISIPGFSLGREFGNVRILRREETEPRVRLWENYNPVIVSDTLRKIMKRVDPDSPHPPARKGVRFVARDKRGESGKSP